MRKCSKPEKYFYLIMNKPCGYVCSAASDSHKTVYELLTPELQKLVTGAPRGSRIHTVGRLDCDTSGLLLITNDGKFSNRITSGTVVECEPSERIETYYHSKSVKENCEDMEQFSRIYLRNFLDKSDIYGGFDTASGLLNHRIRKTYRAKLTAPLSPENQKEYISRAAAGLTLPPDKKYGEQKALPASLIFESEKICKITVLEGKFHEVRRIFRALKNEVIELERIAIGGLFLPQDLKAGQWRELSEAELRALNLSE